MRLRALTFNIRSGTDLLGRRRLAEQSLVVRAAAPDLVLLQEVADPAQAERLAHTADLPYVVFGATRRTATGEFGNALMCRWPLLEIDHHAVPTTRLHGQARAIVSATFLLAGQPVRAIGTHVGLLPGEPERAAAAVLALLAEHAGPAIVGGDFNRPLHSAACHRVLRQHLIDCALADGRTARPGFPAPWPFFRLDYLYVRGLRVDDVAVLPSTASDHRPLLASVRLGSSAE